MKPTDREIRCDGCGEVATPDHLQRRVARLEQATRFRPVHIECLLLQPAPPERSEDYFYNVSRDGNERSASARGMFEALIGAACAGTSAKDDEVAKLAEFQRSGCFLTSCVECPGAGSELSPEEFARRFSAPVIRRVKLSYKPKHIVLLGRFLQPWISVFKSANMEGMLLLQGNRTIDVPELESTEGVEKFRAEISTLLK